MGIRRRRRDLSCLKDETRGSGEIIEETEKMNDTFRGGYGRRSGRNGYGRRSGRGGGRGHGGRRGRGYGQD